MVDYQQWTKIAFQLAAEDVASTRVMSRTAELWRRDKNKIKSMNMAEARNYGKRVL